MNPSSASRFHLLILVSALGFSLPAAKAQNDCAPLLRDGIYNYLQISRSDSLYSDMRKYFKSEQFRSDASSGKWNLGVSIPVGDLPIGLSVGADNQSVKNFQESVERLDESHFVSFCDLFLKQATPNVDAMREYRECLKDRYAIGFSTAVSAVGKYRIFEIAYRPQTLSDPKPKIKSLRVIGAVGTAQTALKPGEEMDLTQFVTVERNPKEAIILLIETDRGTVNASIPPDKVVAPEVVIKPIVIPATSGDLTQGLQIGGPGLSQDVISTQNFAPGSKDMRLKAIYHVNAPASGKYVFDVKYAVGSGQNRTVTVMINQRGVGNLDLPDNGGWTSEYQNWSASRLEVTLVQGHNLVELIRDMPNVGSPAFPHLSFIRFTPQK